MLTRSERQCEVLRVQQDALRASLPPESEKAGYERRIDELESKLALSTQQAAHMAGKYQAQTEQLRQVESQYGQCQQRLTSTTEEMSARISSLLQEREATAKEVSAASARWRLRLPPSDPPPLT